MCALSAVYTYVGNVHSLADGGVTMPEQHNPTPASGGQGGDHVPLRITQIKDKDLIKIEYGDSSPIHLTSDAAFELGKALIEGAYNIQRDKFVKLIPKTNRQN